MPDIKTTFTLAWKYEKRAAREFDRDMDQMVRKAQTTEREFKRASAAVQSVYGKQGSQPRGGFGVGGRGSHAQRQALDLYSGERDRRVKQSGRMRAAGVSQQALMTAGRAGQMMGGAMGGAGGAAGFVGETAGGVGGALAGAAGQGAGVLASGGTFGAAAGAAAAALPVMLVGVAAAAAAKLASGGLSILKTLEPGRRAIFRGTGNRSAPFEAESAAMQAGLRPSAGLAAGGALVQATGSADTATMRRMMQIQQGFGVGGEAQAGMLGAFARKSPGGADGDTKLRMVIAAGMTQSLERGRMHELFGVMSSMASGRAPGLRRLDEKVMAQFLGQAPASLRGQEGQFAMTQLQNFMTKSPMGQAVGMAAAGLGKGANFFDAFQTMQAGPFAAGGVDPKQFVNQFTKMSGMGSDFNKTSGRQKQMLGFMFGESQGIESEAAQKILQMGAGGDKAGFEQAMIDSQKTIEDKTLEVMTSGFNTFESLAVQWEAMLMKVGAMLTPAVVAAVPVIIARMNEWVTTLDNTGITRNVGAIRTGTELAMPTAGGAAGMLLGGPTGAMMGGAASRLQRMLGGDSRENSDSRNDSDGSAMGTHKAK